MTTSYDMGLHALDARAHFKCYWDLHCIFVLDALISVGLNSSELGFGEGKENRFGRKVFLTKSVSKRYMDPRVT
jgi:hypothetical protein